MIFNPGYLSKTPLKINRIVHMAVSNPNPKGAPANALPDPVPEEVKQERWERFMALQQEISAARLQARIGSTIEILVDTVDGKGAVGRSMGDAPEIDGRVFLDGYTELNPGDLVEAEVTAADDYDLWAG